MRHAVAAMLLLLLLLLAGGRVRSLTCPEDLPLRAASAPATDPLHVAKCCPKGQQLDAAFAGSKCVAIDGADGAADGNMEWEDLDSDAIRDWLQLPEDVANSSAAVRVWYNRSCTFHEVLSAVMEADEDMVRALLAVNGSDASSLVLDAFRGRVQPFAVWRQHVCFDASSDRRRPRVALTTLRLRTLFKCCARAQWLDAACEQCVRWPGRRPTDDETELINPWSRDAESEAWLPRRLASTLLEVRYEKGPDPRWNPKGDANDDALWEFRNDDNWGYTVWRHGPAPGDSLLDGVTTRYCFDAAAPAPGAHTPTKVLVTKAPKANKCCRRGESLDARALYCQPSPDAPSPAPTATHTHGDDDEQEVNFAPERSAQEWLPATLRGGRVPVRYLSPGDRRALLGSAQRQVLAAGDGARNWRLQSFRYEVPMLLVSARSASGAEVTARARRFCIDAVAGGPLAPRVLVAELCDAADFGCLPKCCPPGELLSGAGRCAPHGGVDWSPVASALNASLPPHRAYGGRVMGSALCWDYSFSLLPVPRSPADFRARLEDNVETHRFMTKFFCADWVRGEGGVIRETLAYCTIPPSGPLYQVVRPLQVVAAALLAVSVASLLSRVDTRRSTHGRALACHAACLAVSNALQAAWFFTDTPDCETFAYCIYFFLTAAGFWLHVLAVNMARGFARPLEALPRGEGGGRWRFAKMAALAWGGAAALTALCVGVYTQRERAPRWMSRPSFFETRTCFVEYVYSARDGLARKHGAGSGRELGALCYYYAPMALLVAGNAACLALTALRVRRLRRNSSLVLREGARSAPALRPLRTVLLYVKLLVMAGLLELVLEATAWGARRRRFSGPESDARDYFLENAYIFEIAGTFVDLLRAAAVSWLCRWRCACFRSGLRLGPGSGTGSAASTRGWRWWRRRRSARRVATATTTAAASSSSASNSSVNGPAPIALTGYKEAECPL